MNILTKNDGTSTVSPSAVMRLALGFGLSAALALTPVAAVAHHTNDPNEIATPAGVTSSPNTNPYNIRTKKEANNRSTAKLAGIIAGISAFCERAPRETYQVDCLGEQLGEVAASMSGTGDYGEAQQILTRASRDLRALVQNNRARGVRKRKVRGRVAKRRVETKPLTAVRKESVAQVKAQATLIIQEAETRLLRSAEGSEARASAYVQMARAVGSNKTLLRTA